MQELCNKLHIKSVDRDKVSILDSIANIMLNPNFAAKELNHYFLENDANDIDNLNKNMSEDSNNNSEK